MEEITAKLFTEYGPLGAGWLLALLLWRRNNQLSDTIVVLVKEGIAATVATNAVLDAIKDRLTGRSL